MSPKPLGLSDSQYLAICRACEPLQPHERSALLLKLADHLRDRAELGDGELYRLLRDLVRQVWRPIVVPKEPTPHRNVGPPIP